MQPTNQLIQWPRAQYWDKAWNPIIGCDPISPACEHCYALSLIRRFHPNMPLTPRSTKRTTRFLRQPHRPLRRLDQERRRMRADSGDDAEP